MKMAINTVCELNDLCRSKHGSEISEHYWAPKSQVKIIDSISSNIETSLYLKLDTCRFFTLLLDGSKNISHKEEVILRVRYTTTTN